MPIKSVAQSCRIAMLVMVLTGCSQPAAHLSPAIVIPPLEHTSDQPPDRVIEDWLTARRVPGLALAVIEDGRVIKRQNYGFADVKHAIPLRDDTAFCLGSLSKPFLAIGVMMLVQDGKLALHDPISKHLQRSPPAWRNITLRDLLAHTSGVPDFVNKPMTMKDVELFGVPIISHYPDLQTNMTSASLLKLLTQQPLLFPPGTRYSYSNSNYCLLAMILQNVTGKPYGIVLRERIFEPLAMWHTHVEGDGPPFPNTATGHLFKGDSLREWNTAHLTIDGMGAGSGGMISTIEDLTRWNDALSSGQLLSADILHQMWTRQRLGDGTLAPYGLGWQVDDDHGQLVAGHGGTAFGFTSFFFRYTRGTHEVTVIMLSNLGHVDFATLPNTFWATYVPQAHFSSTAPTQPAEQTSRQNPLK